MSERGVWDRDFNNDKSIKIRCKRLIFFSSNLMKSWSVLQLPAKEGTHQIQDGSEELVAGQQNQQHVY